jgi:hypothetical protein
VSQQARREDQDRYAESLAAEIYWAAEMWWRKVDPYHGPRPKWFALRDGLKRPYREMARQIIEHDSFRYDDEDDA